MCRGLQGLEDLHTTTHIHIPHSGSPPIQHFYFFIIMKTTHIKNKNVQKNFKGVQCNEWACDTTAPFD
jgi:hypothetical protein